MHALGWNQSWNTSRGWNASSEGIFCLLLAVTAGYPFSSDACSFQETRGGRQLDQKKKKNHQPSSVLYYLAQYIIIMLENCITFKRVLCIVYYGENSPFWTLLWVVITYFRCAGTAEAANWIGEQHPGRCRARSYNFKGRAVNAQGSHLQCTQKAAPKSGAWRRKEGMANLNLNC